MKQESIDLVNKISDYITSEIFRIENDLFKNISSLGVKKVNFVSKDFEELEQILLTCQEYIDYSDDRIEFMKLEPKGRYEIVDLSAEKYEFRLIEDELPFEFIDGVKYEIDPGFNQNSNHLFDEIASKIDFKIPLSFEELKTRLWVSDTINYHAFGNYRKAVLKIFLELKQYYIDEYELYSQNNIIRVKQPINEKIKWNSSISDLGHIIRNLCDMGYIEFPKDKNREGFNDLIKMGKILLSTFEVSGKLSSIKKTLQSKTKKASDIEIVFNRKISKSDENDLFVVPKIKK